MHTKSKKISRIGNPSIILSEVLCDFLLCLLIFINVIIHFLETLSCHFGIADNNMKVKRLKSFSKLHFHGNSVSYLLPLSFRGTDFYKETFI